MQFRFLAVLATAAFVAAPSAQTSATQSLVALSAGIPNATHAIDFGSGAFPNYTPVANQFAGITVSHARYFTTSSFNNLVGGFLTNDFSGGPNTVKIRFDVPVTDASFVYQQIATGPQSTIRAVLDGVTVASFSGSWNQSQPNNYFGFANSLFDEVQIDFVTDFNIDTLEFRRAAHAKVHNGSGVNPAHFSSRGRPVLGTTWHGDIAVNSGTLLTYVVWSPSGLQAPAPLLGGELLIQLGPDAAAMAGSGSHAVAIPPSPTWAGFTLALQGFRLDSAAGSVAFVPLNALELHLGD